MGFDAIGFGTPARSGNMAAQICNLLDLTGGLRFTKVPVGKMGSVFVSTASQRGGQETTIAVFHTRLLHHGMVRVGLPYVFALPEGLRLEYETIAATGITLRVDCPDLAMGRHVQFTDLSTGEFRKRIDRYADLLGASRPMAEVDCGISVHAGSNTPGPEIAWTKLAALAKGAEIERGRYR